MYFLIRKCNAQAGDTDIRVEISKMGSIKKLKEIVEDKTGVKVENQTLLYKGKTLVDNYQIAHYSIKLNDVVFLMEKPKVDLEETLPLKNKDEKKVSEVNEAEPEPVELINADSKYYKADDLIDVRVSENGAWFEGKIIDIKRDKASTENDSEDQLLFFCNVPQYNGTETAKFCFKDIRPRSFYTYKMSELSKDMKVLINFNVSEPNKRGYWFDCVITEISGKEIKALAQINDVTVPIEKVKFKNEIMRIETSLPKEERKDGSLPNPPLREYPPYCDKCKDNPNRKCNECGCRICSKKDDANLILLCDECNYGFHTYCLKPPLKEVPDDPEWYCPSCKTDVDEIVKAGEGLKVSKKKSKMPSVKAFEKGSSSRDWGRGMACVGRISECTIVPKIHLGPIPGVQVGMLWKYRMQVSEAGVHRPLVAGIHGRESHAAYSIVLSGGYEDDIDNGVEFFYTGAGGRDLSGNKRSNDQSCDQKLKNTNKALALCCHAKLNEKGAEADDWRKGKPVRVVRSYKLAKHSKYAPKEGMRYDGIYKVVKYYPEIGKSGFKIWRYLLRRDDPSPLPWEEGAPKFDIIYPPGYLEGKQEENVEKNKTKKGRKKNVKRKADEGIMRFINPAKKPKTTKYTLSSDCEKYIAADEANKKLWDECLLLLEEGQLNFVNKVQENFSCVCCMEVVYQPVLTPCKHNICQSCLKRSFKAEIYNCPMCRCNLEKDFKLDINTNLASALGIILPGYEAGR